MADVQLMPRAAATVLLLLLLLPATASAAPRDRDRDRMADAWERRHHVSKPRGDRDRDGLTNLREYRLRTDPRRADSDRDGLRDAAELRFGWQPRVRDGDRDGILDGRENAGVIDAVDGLSVTIRLATGGLLTGRLADESVLSCAPALAVGGPSSGGGGGGGAGGDDAGDDADEPPDIEPLQWDPAWGERPANLDGDDDGGDAGAPMAYAAQDPVDFSDPEDEADSAPWTDDAGAGVAAGDGPAPACQALLRRGARVHEAASESGAAGRLLTRLRLVS
jgi:hypothetical protein